MGAAEAGLGPKRSSPGSRRKFWRATTKRAARHRGETIVDNELRERAEAVLAEMDLSEVALEGAKERVRRAMDRAREVLSDLAIARHNAALDEDDAS